MHLAMIRRLNQLVKFSTPLIQIHQTLVGFTNAGINDTLMQGGIKNVSICFLVS